MSDVWLYVRSNDEEKRDEKLQMLRQQAAEWKLNVVGASVDKEGGPMLLRAGLRQAMCSIRGGKAGALLVSSLSSISGSRYRLLVLLKLLQAYHAKLYTVNTQLPYELYRRGLERPLRRRAARFDGFLPY